MNNLHRELAPISEAAWAPDRRGGNAHPEALPRRCAASSMCRGRAAPPFPPSAPATCRLSRRRGTGIIARQRAVQALIELRVPFELDRQAIDDVERGANDSDWQPAKDAARRIAFAEDRAIFDGYAAAGIAGIRQGTSNPVMALPGDVRAYPEVDRPGAEPAAPGRRQRTLFGAARRRRLHPLAETSDQGYPVLQHIKRLVDGEIVWAPAIAGAFVLTTRGGDFDLHIGQDTSIGYLSHTDDAVTLYLQETFTFLLLTTEAAVALNPAAAATSRTRR